MFTNFTKGFLALVLLIVVQSADAQYCNKDITNGILSANVSSSAQTSLTAPKENALDNDIKTDWQVSATNGFIQVDMGTAYAVTNYSITSASTNAAMDPKNFTIEGSADGISYTVLDTRTNEVFASRSLTKYYSFTNGTAYRYYKLNISANNGDASTQLAELQFLSSPDCVVGNVYRATAGVAYPSVPVYLRTSAGTVASTTTDATGRFSFSTTQTPASDYTVLVQPPVNTYFSSGPAVNLNSTGMASSIITKTQQQLWPNGAFLNVNGQSNAPSTYPYLIDNKQGLKTPSSLDWILQATPSYAPTCVKVPTTLDGNGSFGNLLPADYISQHPWQPSFHSGYPAGEHHPLLFKSLTTGSSAYTYIDYLDVANVFSKTALNPEASYAVTSFIGTLNDATFYYNGSGGNTGYNLLNGFDGGWRKTYGHTTGDAYDQFMAVNGSISTSITPLVQFTANVTTLGNLYLNFFGKNANSFSQGTSTPVDLLLKVYDASNTLVSTVSLSLPSVTSAAEDAPTSPWVGVSAMFTATSTGTYTFKMDVPSTSTYGNDFYLDDIVLSQCAIVPITLYSFDANKVDNKVAQLIWKTSAEQNSGYFDVERSSDGRNFKAIGRVAAANNSTTDRSYAFRDLNPLNGTNHYRLKMVDRDGTAKWSAVKQLTFGDVNAINIYPNPVKDFTLVQGLKAGQQVRLIGVDGKKLAQYNVTGNNFSLPMISFTAGCYFLQILDNNGTLIKTEKIIKQ